MKAAVVKDDSTIKITHIENPELGPNDILVQMSACGICGSDVEKVFKITYWYSTQQQSSTTAASEKSVPSILNRIHLPTSILGSISASPWISVSVTSL